MRTVGFDKVRSNLYLTSRKSFVLSGVRIKQTNNFSLYDVKDQSICRSKIEIDVLSFLVTFRLPPKGLGGARRDRTDDLLNANQALSQLSYGPLKPGRNGGPG